MNKTERIREKMLNTYFSYCNKETKDLIKGILINIEGRSQATSQGVRKCNSERE